MLLEEAPVNRFLTPIDTKKPIKPKKSAHCKGSAHAASAGIVLKPKVPFPGSKTEFVLTKLKIWNKMEK